MRYWALLLVLLLLLLIVSSGSTPSSAEEEIDFALDIVDNETLKELSDEQQHPHAVTKPPPNPLVEADAAAGGAAAEGDEHDLLVNLEMPTTTTTTTQQQQPQAENDELETPPPPPPTAPPSGPRQPGAAVCPPGSTVDGLWGLSNPRYNTVGFYHQHKFARPLGRWMRGHRALILRQACRRDDESAAPAAPAADACEWGEKPDDFSPFRGSAKYWLNTTAAYYTRHGVSPGRRAEDDTQHDPDGLTWCYDFQNPRKCLHNKVIVFIGDSHMLNHAQVVCRMLLKTLPRAQSTFNKGPCGVFDVRFTKPLSVALIPTTNTTIALLRVRYQLESQMHARFDPHPWARYLEHRASVVVYNRAIWDIVYKDTPRDVAAREYAESLKYLAHKFPPARIVLKMLHYDHKFMFKNCSSVDRQRQVRDANVCGAYLAMADIGQQLASLKRSAIASAKTKAARAQFEAYDPYQRFSVWDTYGMTRELPYNEATDKLGHHYEGAAIESLTQMLLSIVCPSQPQNYTTHFRRFERVAKMSCDRVLNAPASEVRRQPLCACNDATLLQVPAAKLHCLGLLMRQGAVPWFTDL